jgi:hypothetical protein
LTVGGSKKKEKTLDDGTTVWVMKNTILGEKGKKKEKGNLLGEK